MNHSDLVSYVSTTNKLTKAASDRLLRDLYAKFASELRQGNVVTLLGFGKLKAKTRAARLAKNPQTGDWIKVPERKVAVLKQSTAGREALNG